MSTPDVVESPFGRLRFFDGVPTTESVHRIYDALDLIAPVPDPSVVHHLAGLPWLATRASSNDDGSYDLCFGHRLRTAWTPSAGTSPTGCGRTGASPQTIMARTSYAPRLPARVQHVRSCPVRVHFGCGVDRQPGAEVRPAADVVHACDPLRVGPGFDDRLGPPGVEMLQQLVQVVTQRVQ
jgi:hypothetical protein